MGTRDLRHEQDGSQEITSLKFDVFQRACPARSALDHVTGRWEVLVLGGLHEKPMRFNELFRRVEGVSEKMLSQALHTLCRDGFVQRTVHNAIPPHVEYNLTPLGQQAATKLRELMEQIEAMMPDVMAARERYDQSTKGD